MGRRMTGATLILLSLVLLPAVQAQRGPSTPEERKRMVDVVHKLQADPLNPRLHGDEQWALKWVEDVPDITVTVCPELLSPVLASSYRYKRDLALFSMLAAASFIIQNPDKAANTFEVNKGSLEMTLDAYRAILRTQPGAKSSGMDDLERRRLAGSLDNFVRHATESCTVDPNAPVA